MNGNINEKAKKTKKFKPNIIDFLVVVIIIGAIVGIVLRNSNLNMQDSQGELEKVRISFRVADISADTGECFNVGNEFFSVTHDTVFGTLESSWTNPAEIYVADQNGVLHKREAIDDRVDLRGTFICEGVFTENGFMLGGDYYISANSEVAVKSPSVSSNIVITDIERITSAEE